MTALASRPPQSKVAIVAHSHPSVSKGGAEIAAYTLYQGLRAIGVDTIFIAACPQALVPRLTLNSADEHVIVQDDARYERFYHLAAIGLAERLQRILAEQRVQLVNFHHFLNIGLNGLRAVAEDPGLRVVLTLHEFLAICHHHGQMVKRPSQRLCQRAAAADCAACFPEHTPQQFAMRRDLFLEALASVDELVSPSRFLAERFAAWEGRPRRVTVIENGLRTLPPPDRRVRAGDGPRVFGFFGQINPFKGVDTLLAAADLLSQRSELAGRVELRIHGNIVGQPDSFVAAFGAAVAAHPFLSYAGPYDNTDVGELMAACDCVVVPSKWWENSPVVIQEAFAARRPVLCSGIGGMAEKVADGVSGLHFRPSDPRDLVRAIAEAADPERWAALQGGIPRVYDGARMAHRYMRLFRRVTAAGAGRPQGQRIKRRRHDEVPSPMP